MPDLVTCALTSIIFNALSFWPLKFSLVGVRLIFWQFLPESFSAEGRRGYVPSAWALALQPCTFAPLLLGRYYNLSYVNAW